MSARRLTALALLAPLTAAGLVAAASPAYAAGSISAPGDGVTYPGDTTVQIRADVSSNQRTELRLKSPSGAEQVVDSVESSLTTQSSVLTYALDTSCATYPSSSCTGRVPAANGTWSVRLAGGATDSSTFVLRIPPRAPQSVTARAEGYRAVVVSWRKGEEPDLTGWTLYGDGGVVQESIGLESCSGGTCSTTVTYSSDGTGTHTYALAAKRLTAPGSSDVLVSDRSAEASASLDAPPPPPPPAEEPSSGGGSDGGATGGTSSGGTTGEAPSGGSTGGTSTGGSTGGTSTGGSTGGTSTGGSTGTTSAAGPSGSANGLTTSSKPAVAIAQRRAFALTFKAFGPKLGIPKLPPLPATQPAVAAPLPDGTYETTLGYKDVVTREKVSAPRAAASKVTGAVGSALDSEQFLRSLAGALVLLLLAAHLRRWLGSHTEHSASRAGALRLGPVPEAPGARPPVPSSSAAVRTT